MRVLLVTNDWPPDVGGIQTYLTGLVARTTHDVRVLAPAAAGAPRRDDEVRHDAGFLWPTRAVGDWIADHVRESGADLVWFGAPHPPALLGPRVGRLTGVPYAVLCHGAEVSVGAAIPGVRGALRRSLAGAALVMAVSEHTAGVVGRLSGRPVRRLGVGVEGSGLPRGAVGERMTVVSVGRFVRRKGLESLVDAMAEVRDARLVLVGDGPRRRHLVRRAAQRGVDLEVRSGLDTAGVRATLRSADVFAQPCRTRAFGLDWEGLGIVFLEAAAEGVPVIAGRSGGAPETILPGVTGFLAEGPGEVAAALSALGRPGVGAAMGEAGRRMVGERWQWDDVIARFDRWVEEAARG